MNTREELLQGLYCVKERILEILKVYERQRQIVASYRQKVGNISVSGVKNQSKLIVLALVGSVFMYQLLCAVIRGDYTNVFLTGLAVFILYIKQGERSKLKVFSIVLLAWTVVEQIYVALINGLYLAIIFLAVFVVAILCVVFALIRKQNKKIDSHKAEVTKENMELQRQYQQTVELMSAYKKELQQKTSDWYPRAYYTEDAIKFFVDAVENYRADSIKELVNLYETSEHYKRMEMGQKALLQGQERIIEGQKVLISGQERLIEGQKDMLAQLKFANVLNVANLAMQARTQNMIQENTNAVNAVRGAVKENTSAVNRVGKSVNKINNRLR